MIIFEDEPAYRLPANRFPAYRFPAYKLPDHLIIFEDGPSKKKKTMIYHVLIMTLIVQIDIDGYCEDDQNVLEVAEHDDNEEEEDDNEDLNAVEIAEHQPPHLHIYVFLTESQKVARKSGNDVFYTPAK